MTRELDWHYRFVGLAERVALWSKDPRRRVGAVVVDSRRRVVGVGYNGPPPRVYDGPDRLDLAEVSVHAELNAVLNSAPGGTRGATLYCTAYPCAQCAAAIVAAGVVRVVCYVRSGEDLDSRWRRSWTVASDLLKEADVETVELIRTRPGDWNSPA